MTDIERELWARDQQNTPLEERAAHELKRRREEIERLRTALREIAEIKPRTVEVQTDYGTDIYKTLVDDKAISIARRALEGKDG